MKFDIKKMIRPCCENFQPYVAGKPIETIKRELGLKRVIKLASNENPLGPSPKAISAIKEAMRDIYFYPDSGCWSLRQAVSKKFGIQPDMILLGSGSDEIIELIAKVFFKPQDEVVASEHAFIRYQMAGDLMNCKVVSVPMNGYTHDLEAMFKAVTPRTKAVFIANPNNPTGTYNTRAQFESFMKKMASRSVLPLVIVDEAYYEYARPCKDYPETASYLSRYPNLVILRTFSKIYGLAGLRVGYGFASPEVVDYIERIRPPFNVNSLAQLAAAESLTDTAQVAKGVRLVGAQREYLCRELKKQRVPYVPSAANFLLVDVRPNLGRAVFQKLLKKGVIVRAMDEYNYPNHIRVTIGLPQENRVFIAKLKEVLE